MTNSDPPQNSDLLCDKAQLLTDGGRLDEARDLYLDILRRTPTHFRALNNLGTLLHSMGFRAAARTAYGEAVAQHPDQTIARVNLANVLREDGENDAAFTHYTQALEREPGCAEAHRGLAYIFRFRGEEDKAQHHRRLGFAGHSRVVLPHRGTSQPIRAVMVISAAGGNLPIQSFLDQRVFHVTAIVAEYDDPTADLPPHTVFINAIGDADLCADALEAASRLAEKTTARIINHPRAVRVTGRTANAARLRAIPNVVVPVAIHLPRQSLTGNDGANVLAKHGLGFPVLLRSPGFHAGQHLVKVDDAAGLAQATEGLPGADLICIQFLDARSSDRKIRKYRVMTIGRQLNPLHMAISSHWKVHYFSAEMADQPQHRAEEDAFLRDMAGALRPKTMASLSAIAQAVDLDYAGIDFSVSAAGDVLLYEVNANMMVPRPEPDERWAYRRPAILRVREAIDRLLRGDGAAS